MEAANMVSPTDEDLDQQIEDSSPSDEQDTDNAEDSSVSKTPEEESSTFDVVMNAIKTDEEEDDGESESSSEEDDSDEPEGEEGKTEDKSGEEDKSDEPSEEELKAWKPKTRKRFEDLQAKYREEKSLREEAEVEAGYYKQFTTFLETNRISEDEANELFNIGATMKNDPQKALELMTPYYNNLLQITGNVLPPDLKQQVDQGYITKAHALELSRLKAAGQTNQVIQQDQQQYQQQQEVARQQGHAASMQSAIKDWEAKWSTSDPDYSAKKDRVLDRVELMLARAQRDNKLPQTVEAAIELANSAKADVEAEIRKITPRKAVNTVDGGKSSSSMPEPKNTSDVIRRALNNN